MGNQQSLRLEGILDTITHKHPIVMENFNLTDRLEISSFGDDQSGRYSYQGRMMPDGRFYMYKTYPSIPSFTIKTLAGSLTEEGRLEGHAYEGQNVNSVPIGSFVINPKFNRWTGTSSAGGRPEIPLSLNLKAIEGGHLFGFGLKQGFVYLLVGKLFLGESKVTMLEMWLPDRLDLKKTYTRFHGRYTMQGMKTLMEGLTETRFTNDEVREPFEKGKFCMTFDAQAVHQPQQPRQPQQPMQHMQPQQPRQVMQQMQPMQQPAPQVNPYFLQYGQVQNFVQPMMQMVYPQPTPYKPAPVSNDNFTPPIEEIDVEMAPSKRQIKTVSFSNSELLAPKGNSQVSDDFDFDFDLDNGQKQDAKALPSMMKNKK